MLTVAFEQLGIVAQIVYDPAETFVPFCEVDRSAWLDLEVLAHRLTLERYTVHRMHDAIEYGLRQSRMIEPFVPSPRREAD